MELSNLDIPKRKRQKTKSPVLPLFNLLYRQNNGFIDIHDYDIQDLLACMAPNFDIPSREDLRGHYFDEALTHSRQVLASAVYLPFIVVFSKEYEGQELILSIAQDTNQQFFFIKADSIPLNLHDFGCKINSFLHDSINLVNGYLSKNKYSLYQKVEFVIIESRCSVFQSSVEMACSPRTILTDLMRSNNVNVGRLQNLGTIELYEFEIQNYKDFISDLRNLKTKLDDMTFAEFGNQLLELSKKFEQRSSFVKEEFETKILNFLTPLYLIANVVHPLYMGQIFYDKNVATTRTVNGVLKRRFGNLDTIRMFLEKRGTFWEDFDTQGKLKAPYEKFWPSYVLDYKDLSLFARGLLAIPAKFPEYDLVNICLACINSENHPQNSNDDVKDDAIFLLRFLMIQKYNKYKRVEGNST